LRTVRGGLLRYARNDAKRLALICSG